MSGYGIEDLGATDFIEACSSTPPSANLGVRRQILMALLNEYLPQPEESIEENGAHNVEAADASLSSDPMWPVGWR